MPFKKAKDDKDNNNHNVKIEDGYHNLFWVANDKTKNVRIINKVDNFFIVFMHKKYENNITKLKICDKDEIIGKDNCNLCNNNKAIKIYLTEVLPLDYYYKPEQLRTKLWIVPPFKYSDVFEKFDITQSKVNKNYDIKDYIFIVRRENNRYTLSYNNNYKFNHNFISADEDYWVNYIKENYYYNVNFDNNNEDINEIEINYIVEEVD